MTLTKVQTWGTQSRVQCTNHVSNRIKKVLPAIISHTQKGFLKYRSIGENTRLIYNIVDKLNSNNEEGLLHVLLIDFEKAFHSVEWNFFDEAFKFFNFRESIRQWVKIIFRFVFYRTTPYVIALVIAKFLHTFGLFVTYEQLKIFHVVQFLFIVKLWYVMLRLCSYNI